jgi:hypothetical protein
MDRHAAKAALEDQAANAAKAADPQWSGAALRAQDGEYLEAGQDLLNPVRAFLSSSCRDVAGAEISNAHIRVEKGGPTPTITCKLAAGGRVTIKIDEDGNPHRFR